MNSKRLLVFSAGLSLLLIGIARLPFLSHLPFRAGVFIGILYALVLSATALGTTTLLALFWTILPFIGLLKRMVYLDPHAGEGFEFAVLILPDVLLVILITRLIAKWLSSKRIRRLRQLEVVDLFAAAFAIYSLLSALLSPRALPIQRISAAGFWVWPMATYFLAGELLRHFRLSALLRSFVAIATAVSLYGIMQFFWGMTPFETAWFQRSSSSLDVHHLSYDLRVGIFRTFGTLGSHSSYGILLGMGVVLLWSPRLKKNPYWWPILLIILLTGLTVSFTRFTWFMPVLAAFFIIFLARDRVGSFSWASWRKPWVLVTFIVGSYLVFQAGMFILYGRSIRGLLGLYGPYAHRILGSGTLAARLRWPHLDDIRVFGNGLANARFFAAKFGARHPEVNYHDILVNMLQSLGVVGLVLFVVFLYALFAKALQTLTALSGSRERRGFTVLFGLLMGLLTIGHFNGAVFHFGHAIPFYFWAFCGLLTHFKDPEPSQPQTSSLSSSS